MRLYHPEVGDARAAALRWGTAGFLVVALHAGLGWWIARHIVPATPPDTVRGIPIYLEPVATPTNASEPTMTSAGGAAPTPQIATAPAEPQPAPEAAPVPNPAPAPPETTAAAEPPPNTEPQPLPPEPPLSTPDSQSEPEQAHAPPLPTAPLPEPPPVALPQKDSTSDAVVAAPPQRRPAPDSRAAARNAARRKTKAEKQERQRAVRALAGTQAQASARTRAAQIHEAGGPGPAEAAPSSASSGAAVATWRGAVQAHLRAFTPSGTGRSGTARVSFSLDRSGRVVSAALAGSSGDPELDSAAVSMVRRASPVPAPPPELGARVSLSVPVHFQ